MKQTRSVVIATRDQCRAAILIYLRGRRKIDVPIDEIEPLYHAFYPRGANGATRWTNMSYFVRRMEDDGLVRCIYGRLPGPGRKGFVVLSLSVLDVAKNR